MWADVPKCFVGDDKRKTIVRNYWSKKESEQGGANTTSTALLLGHTLLLGGAAAALAPLAPTSANETKCMRRWRHTLVVEAH